ncbi:MAG: hypothetical protein ACI8P9_005507 [Parasphingorhabdus sp.]|jgi:hypothetical protein
MNSSIDQIRAGVINLLSNCANVQTEDRVLLVGENGEGAFFNESLCADVAAIARQLDITTEIVFAKPVADASQFPSNVSERMHEADITIFFSRLGDQVRFIKSPGEGRKVMTYTLTQEHLSSSFSQLDHQPMARMHDLLVEQIKTSSHYQITAPCGTSLRGNTGKQVSANSSAVTEFSVGTFPIMIFPPVNVYDLEGKLILNNFLTSSSTRSYENSVLYIDTPVTAIVKDSRMADFFGESDQVRKIENQLEKAAQLTGGDPYRINSWHTGINPFSFYNEDPHANIERWGTAAFGSPRYTHFHASGHNPGDIAIQLFDASIQFDDEYFWNSGQFDFLKRPDVLELFPPEVHQQLLNTSLKSIGL